ncbi:MAG TPA: SDR family NAD(P)-dependent oxidoreductase [Cytophagaceae bacterium]
MLPHSKICLITGATSGIGEATARLLSKQGFSLILCGRRSERLLDLEAELSEKVGIHTLCFDISKRADVEAALASLPLEWQNIDILVNNAGNAHGFDLFQEGKIEDWEMMIDINLKGLLYISQPVIQGMVKRKFGQIINIGSIAGKEVYPKGNVYSATKHAVDALTTAMRMDLNAENIRVCSINPGMVNTEFSNVRFKGDVNKAEKVYEGMTPLVPNDIAEIILFVITRPPHVTVADLTVLPTAQASATIVKRD